MAKVSKVILLIETSRTYGRQLLRGIANYSGLHGPWAFYRQPPFYRNPASRQELLAQMKDWGADGIITREHETVEEILAMGLPTVVAVTIKERIPQSANIVTDNPALGKMAAEHLLDRGFRRFAYCGFNDMHWSRERGESFDKRVIEAGFQTNFYERSRYLRAKEQTQLISWLKSLPKPAGIMACNDDHGQNVIDACGTAGLHIPADVAVLGVDNDELICDLSNPRLSSIAVSTERAGYEAAEMLDKMMAGKKVTNKTIVVKPLYVVTRQSTDILAIEDRDVAEAVRFIRRHSREVIRVNDVVDAIPLSRRVLERRFRKVLGRSVYQEIRRLRVEQVCRMLLETNLPVWQIAVSLGYPGVEHIARYFRREKGMNPLTYRKRYGGK